MDINPVLFPAVSNRESWQNIIGLYDIDTGEPIDLTDLTFVCEIRRTGQAMRPYDSGYSNFGDIGAANDYGPQIVLTLGAGLTVVDLGMLQVSISLDQMRTLSPDTYSIAMTASNGVDQRQLFLGRLPILFGGVS